MTATEESTSEKLRALRGKHDQTARCEEIKIVVDHHYGTQRWDKNLSVTEAFPN